MLYRFFWKYLFIIYNTTILALRLKIFSQTLKWFYVAYNLCEMFNMKSNPSYGDTVLKT